MPFGGAPSVVPRSVKHHAKGTLIARLLVAIVLRFPPLPPRHASDDVALSNRTDHVALVFDRSIKTPLEAKVAAVATPASDIAGPTAGIPNRRSVLEPLNEPAREAVSQENAFDDNGRDRDTSSTGLPVPSWNAQNAIRPTAHWWLQSICHRAAALLTICYRMS